MNAQGWLSYLAAGAVLCAGRARRRPRRRATGSLRQRAGTPRRRPPGLWASATTGPDATKVQHPPWLRLAATTLVVAWVAAVFGVEVAVFALGAGFATRAVRHHRRRRRTTKEQARAVPDLVDLFKLAASAGQPPAAAVVTVAARAPAPLRPAVEAAHHHLTTGGTTAGAFEQLARGLGPPGQELVDALTDAARTGTPLVPVLDRVGATARDRRTREAEEAARRLPVMLLFPLAGCVLPAAVLLAVVPVLAGSLAALAS